MEGNATDLVALGKPHLLPSGDLEVVESFVIDEADRIVWQALKSLIESHPEPPNASVELIRQLQTFTLFNEGGRIQEAWWELIYQIANDSKHVRLTPQTVDRTLGDRIGHTNQHRARVEIEYSEPCPMLRTWSFYRFLQRRPDFPEFDDRQQRELSRVVYRLLREHFFVKRNLKQLGYHAPKFEQTSSDMIRQAFSELSPGDQAHLPSDWDYASEVIFEFYTRRADRFVATRRDSHWKPDFAEDLFDLMERAINGTQSLLVQFFADMNTGQHPVPTAPVMPPQSLDSSCLILSQFNQSVRRALVTQFKSARDQPDRALDKWTKILEEQGNDWTRPFILQEQCKLLLCRYSESDRLRRAHALIDGVNSCITNGYTHLADWFRMEANYHIKNFLSYKQRPDIPKIEESKSLVEADLRCQHQHCVEQVEALRWACTKLFSQHPSKPGYQEKLLNKCMSQACDILIKLRGIMDQTYGRSLRYILADLCSGHVVLQAKFPKAGSVERIIKDHVRQEWFPISKKKSKSNEPEDPALVQAWKKFETEAEYQPWWNALHQVQMYTDPDAWWHTVITITNEIKHVRQIVPPLNDIQQHLEHLQQSGQAPIHSDMILYFLVGDAKLSSGHWLEEVKEPTKKVEISIKIMESLYRTRNNIKEFMSPKTFKAGDRLLSQSSKVELEKALLDQWQAEGVIDPSQVEVGRLVDRLWAHRQYILDKEAMSEEEKSTFYRKHQVIELLQNAVRDVGIVLTEFARYNLPTQE